MANVKAIGAAYGKVARNWYVDAADAILDRNKSWGEVWSTLWDRAEDAQHDLVHEWRQAGVRHPMTALTGLAEVGGIVYALAFMRWPRAVIKFTLAVWFLPTLLAMLNLLIRRQPHTPRRLRALSAVEETRHHPLLG